MLTRALRNDSLSFLTAYEVPPFLPFVPGGGLGGDGVVFPFAASQVLLRKCFAFLPKPIIISIDKLDQWKKNCCFKVNIIDMKANSPHQKMS